MNNGLASIRARLDMTQAELAAALGVSQGNITHCEMGRQDVSPRMARKLLVVARERGLQITFDDVYLEAGAEHADV